MEVLFMIIIIIGFAGVIGNQNAISKKLSDIQREIEKKSNKSIE